MSPATHDAKIKNFASYARRHEVTVTRRGFNAAINALCKALLATPIVYQLTKAPPLALPHTGLTVETDRGGGPARSGLIAISSSDAVNKIDSDVLLTPAGLQMDTRTGTGIERIIVSLHGRRVRRRSWISERSSVRLFNADVVVCITQIIRISRACVHRR